MSALNATKRDLAEFVSVLGSDTKAVVQGASENINKILVQPSSSSSSASESGEQDRNNQKNGGGQPVSEVRAAATPYDRCQAELYAVQNSSETYLQDPSQGEENDYEGWKSTFDIKTYQNDISSLLVSCSHVRTMHSQLVPAKVSYEAFWTRYFYRMQLLKKEEKQRADLMARASNRSQEQLQWDEEIDDVIGSPLVFKVEGCGQHQRSGSSTDSFVCISEETGLDGEGACPPGDMGSWEQVGSELGTGSRSTGSTSSRVKLSEMGEEEGNGGGLGNLLKEKESLLRSIEMITDIKERTGEDNSSSSDWENWDD